jgi:SH3-like domain-containing protein
MKLSRILAGLVLLAQAAASQAFDFKSIAPAAVVLYDAPSAKGGKLFIAPRGMPVEVVLAYGEWVKVRDVSGDLAWTEARNLSPKRTVIVRVANARVRSAADDAAAPVMAVDKGVLLELVEPVPGAWLKVRHKDGSAGFIRAAEVWGV